MLGHTWPSMHTIQYNKRGAEPPYKQYRQKPPAILVEILLAVLRISIYLLISKKIWEQKEPKM